MTKHEPTDPKTPHDPTALIAAVEAALAAQTTAVQAWLDTALGVLPHTASGLEAVLDALVAAQPAAARAAVVPPVKGSGHD